MKKISVLALVAVVTMGITFTSCDSKNSTGSVKLTSGIDSISYIFGKANGSQAKKNAEAQVESWPEKGVIDAYMAGFMNGLENADDTLYLGKNMQEADMYVNEFFMNAQMKAQQPLAEENKAKGELFLAENKTKDGVIITESGLQYKVITEGKGAKPKAEDIVRVHYIGKFLDGVEFNNSIEGGQPAEFPLGNVIQGWTEGIQLMTIGSKYIFWIPSDLAYGEMGRSPAIGPNATLEFEVELLDIVKQ